jgi:phenylpyruvate tautomerase
MPYIKLNTNATMTSDQSSQLLGRLSQVMAKETGKPERYVMVEINENKAMLFAGSKEPLAYLECKNIGLSAVQAKSISAVISNILKDSLQVNGDRIYIEFSNCSGEFWGWNGSTFA